MQAIADRGYFSGPQIKTCEETGITTYVPKPMTSTSKANGHFSKADFIYIRRDDEYQCPAGERLRWRQTTLEKGPAISAGCTPANRSSPSNRLGANAPAESKITSAELIESMCLCCRRGVEQDV